MVKKQKKEEHGLKNKFSEVVFPVFWPLDAGTLKICPKFRILREISSPEPAGKLQNPDFKSQNEEIYF